MKNTPLTIGANNLPSTNYFECKLEVKAVVPGSLPSFLYAYCKTANVPDRLEPAFIRKAVSFAKLSRYVRQNITNDFDTWYRCNEDSAALCEVLATIINAEENRTETYGVVTKPQPWVSEPFYSDVFGFEVVLVKI